MVFKLVRPEMDLAAPFMDRKILCIAFYFVLVLAGSSYAQVVINEVQSANFSSLQNETAEYEDWIELYNAGSTYVNLGGYGLSDSSNNLFKFTFPPYLLPAGKHVLIFADDTNQVNVGAHWETAVKADDTWKYLSNLVAPPDTNWPISWPGEASTATMSPTSSLRSLTLR